MIRKIVDTKNPGLRKVSKPIKNIDKKILRLAKDLKDTLEAQKDPEGVGLAAPQIGRNVRMFAMKYTGDILVVINPEIISLDKKSEQPTITTTEKEPVMEGCLSIIDYYGPLKRPQKLTLKYQNLEGEKVTHKFTGFPAQIVQHEVDHLDGILFVDKLIEQKESLFQLINDDWEKVDLPFST